MECLFQQSPMDFLEDYTICIYGYHSEERKIMKEMIEFCGGTYTEYFNIHKITFIIGDENINLKGHNARRVGIPIIRAQWLFDSFSERRLLSINNYLL